MLYKDQQEEGTKMERKMFGYRTRKSQTRGMRDPGRPVHDMDSDEGKAEDNPPNYEGKEHVRYKNPGYSSHHIRYPEDEPHMKSNVSRDETHEMEDNYHMGVPDQTEDSLPAKIKRARMKMDDPDYYKPKPLLGNPVHNVPYEGEEDTTGEEEMGPHDMQGESKEHRKKMVVAVMKRKMKKQGYNDRLDESMGERSGKKSQSYKDRRDESEDEEEHYKRRKFGALRSSR